jgi:hypothetical protein
MAVLRRALHAMDRRLADAWAMRAANTPLKSADEALILASIVEKETGRAADRAQIAGVFSNRLRIGMRLQTDPSVIYGVGASFDGNLRKRDLLEDTPWNTYTRAGLPVTPIAMPGKAALMAAVQPDQTKALYFVARAMAPAISAPRWTSTIGPSTATSAVSKQSLRAQAVACALCRIKQLVPPCAALEEISVSTALPKGLFISFEGIDGAGKSSHIEALAQAFRDQGRVVTLTREPGGTPLAEKLRALMLHDAMDPLTEALIAFAARRDHLVQVIEPALARGEVVISDRFTDATFAYQGAGRGFSWEQLSALERMAQTGTRCRQGRPRISCASPT